MRVTFDTNVWPKVVKRKYPKDKNYKDLVAIHEALRCKRIKGFICETVGTLEDIGRKKRAEYLSTIRRHDQHPGLATFLQTDLTAAFALGLRLMRAARIGLAVPVPFLNLDHYADEQDIAVSADRDNRWGDVLEEIELRGAGGGALKAVKEISRRAVKASDAELEKFADAVSEWADGDSVAAHVAYNNDVFCTEDQGRNAGEKSILHRRNRLWLQNRYGTRFATIRELAEQIAAL